MITDGSCPAPRRISNTIAVVVDLPLVPDTATERNALTQCASISERCTIGSLRCFAAATSGTVSSTAVEITSAPQSSARPLPSCGHTFTPSFSSCARASGRSSRSKPRSLPLARPPSMAWNCASALMPLPPTPA